MWQLRKLHLVVSTWSHQPFYGILRNFRLYLTLDSRQLTLTFDRFKHTLRRCSSSEILGSEWPPNVYAIHGKISMSSATESDQFYDSVATTKTVIYGLETIMQCYQWSRHLDPSSCQKILLPCYRRTYYMQDQSELDYLDNRRDLHPSL